jgi:hypothetical protein
LFKINKDKATESLQTTTVASKFQIEKRPCWPFSKTIRVNVKPLCLLINKTRHRLKLIQRDQLTTDGETTSTAPTEIIYDLDSHEGQLCLADLSASKRYKLAIHNEEYMVASPTTTLELSKCECVYESGWFVLKDEPISPFYRHNSVAANGLASLFLVNKCWIDLKLYPVSVGGQQQSMCKQFYFVLSNEQEDVKPGQSPSYMSGNGINCKILTIRPKFVLTNKTSAALKFKLMNEFVKQTEVNKLLSRYIQPDEYVVSAGEESVPSYPADEIIDKKSFYVLAEPVAMTNSSVVIDKEEDAIAEEIRQQRDMLNDLFYVHVESVDGKLVRQSKPLMLTCNESALKQMSSTQSNSNLLISRQCFSVYGSSANNG